MFMTHVSKYRMSTKEIIKYKHKFIFRRIFYKCLKTSLHVENEKLKWGKIFFIIHLETNFMLRNEQYQFMPNDNDFQIINAHLRKACNN